jgi:type II secretory pathway predicted ATPase ExeA
MALVSLDSSRIRPLAGDPDFLSELSALDQPRSASSPTLGYIPSRFAEPLPAPPERPRGRRPLLDLFPEEATAAAEPSAESAVARPEQSIEPPGEPGVEPPGEPGVEPPGEPGVEPPGEPLFESPSPVEPPRPYQAFYGFQEQPFALVPDLKFLYHGTELDRVTQAMLGAIGRRDRIVVLSGEFGVGKTMLCQALVEQLDRRTLTSYLPQPVGSIEQLLRALLVDFGVVSHADMTRGRFIRATEAELTAVFKDFVASLQPLQVFAVVVIDDAQRLPVHLFEGIQALLAEGSEQPSLQVVLVGDPDLKIMLRRSNLRAFSRRIALRSELGPLTPEELQGYVGNRMGVASASPGDADGLMVANDGSHVEFDEAALAELYVRTGGLPRFVNLVCDRALAAGFDRTASSIDKALVEAAADELGLTEPSRGSLLRRIATTIILALLLLTGAAAGAYIFRDDLRALITQWRGAAAPNGPAVAPDQPPGPR